MKVDGMVESGVSSLQCAPHAIVAILDFVLSVGARSVTRFKALKPEETHFALSRERYNVQNTPHVDWKGTRYGSGMKRKLTSYAGPTTSGGAAR